MVADTSTRDGRRSGFAGAPLDERPALGHEQLRRGQGKFDHIPDRMAAEIDAIDFICKFSGQPYAHRGVR